MVPPPQQFPILYSICFALLPQEIQFVYLPVSVSWLDGKDTNKMAHQDRINTGQDENIVTVALILHFP